MQRESDISITPPTSSYPEIEAAKLQRQQQQQQTLEWISTNALSTVRLVWHNS